MAMVDRDASNVNPYTSPEYRGPAPRPPRRAVFEVGEAERHTVEIFLSLWGTEVYVVDGADVLRLSSLALRATRRFEVGEQEKHVVEVVLDTIPTWRSLVTPDWKAEVYVDGELRVAELFPDMRRRFKRFTRISNWVLPGLLVVCVLTIVALMFTLLFFD